MHSKYALMGLTVAASLAFSGAAQAMVVDLNDWTAESYPAVAGFGAGVWTPEPDGSSVTQSVNGQPTIYYSDFNAHGTLVTGTIRVTGGDDDFMGFVLGFNAGDTANAAANYLLVDWKRGTQNFDFGAPSNTPGGVANAGLAVSRVTGIPTADEFWQHVDFAGNPGGGLEELQRGANLGATGWVANTDYEFSFDFGPNNLVVSVNGVEELNIAGAFGNGSMGFYNFSQAGVIYSAFERNQGGFPGVPEPGTWAMLIAGFGLVGAAMRRRKVRITALPA